MAAANSFLDEGKVQAKSDVVKRGLLKFKASKVKGTVGASARGPKSSKSVFLVFRSLHSGDKFLHIYTNEKKFHEADSPKWEVILKEASSVYFLSDKKNFCMAMTDGGLLFMDCSSVDEAEDWVRCLNAVLFAKNISGESVLQYEVDMMPNRVLSHEGPCVLELTHYELVVWDRQLTREIVRWKLNHLRSFKAKNKTLTIISGSRSCTGHKEFEFQSRYSVQITHTIETIVARVKYRSSPSTQQSPRTSTDNSNMSVTRSHPHGNNSTMLNNIPNILDPIHVQDEEGLVNSAMLADIPDFTHYDVCDNSDVGGVDEYGKLQRFPPGTQLPGATDIGAGTGMPPRVSPPRSLAIINNSSSQYDVIDTPRGRGAGPHAPTPTSRKVVRNVDYEEIDSPRKLDNSRLDKSPRVPLPRETSGPPVAHRQVSQPALESSIKTPVATGSEVYGKLEHGHITSPVNCVDGEVQHDVYSSLNHRNSPLPPPLQEEYGELDIPGKNTSVSGSSHPYENCSISSAKAKGYEVLQSGQRTRKTVHSHDYSRSRSSESEEYGKLSHGVGKPTQLAPQEPGARGKVVSGGFNPYATIPREKRASTTSNTSLASTGSDFDDIIEEEFSTPIFNIASDTVDTRCNRESRSTLEGTPPPGYETLTTYSKVASSQGNPSSSQQNVQTGLSPHQNKPPAPPRRTSSNKRRYENVDPNGKVLSEVAPDVSTNTASETQVVISKPDVLPSSTRRYENVSPNGEVLAQESTSEASDGAPSETQVLSKSDHPTPSDKKPAVKARTGVASYYSSTSSEDSKPQPAPKPKVRPKPKNVESVPSKATSH